MTGCLKGDHQYVALWRQGVVRCANSPSTEKTLITKEKEEKMGLIITMKTNSNGERTYDWPLVMYDHCTDQEAFVLRLMSSGNTR
jgi:hypothetical protein